MKIKFKWIIIFAFIIIYNLNPIEVYADNGFSIGKSASTDVNSVPNQNRVILPNCQITNTTDIIDYAHNCVHATYPIKNVFSHKSEELENGKTKYTVYYAGRVDVWGYNTNSGKIAWKGTRVNYNWTDAHGNNFALYPGMELSYRRYEELDYLVGEEFVDTVLYSYNTGQLKLNGKAIKKLPKDTNDYYVSVSVDPNNFEIGNFALEKVNGKWYVAFDVNIKRLRTGWNQNYGNLTGIPGTTNGHDKNTKAYHYFLPIALEFEYLHNKCLGDKTIAEQYAKNNPDTCCVEFPDTCDLCTSLDYAKANPGITKRCCEKFPETCCNIKTTRDNQEWLGGLNADNIWTKHYKNSWHGNSCCSDPNFAYNNPDKCSNVSQTFVKTIDKTCPVNYKTEYIYTTSYVQLYEDGTIDSDIKCDYNSGVGACTRPYTYSYTISIDSKKNIFLNEFGYSYFSKSNGYADYNAYLKQRENNKVTEVGGNVEAQITPPSGSFYSNSLSDTNFNYKISNLRVDPNNSNKYLVDITVTVYNLSKHYTNTPSPYEYKGTKVFFVPIKIHLCLGQAGDNTNSTNTNNNNTCSNMDYAKNHVNECCKDSAFGKNNKFICCGDSDYYNSNKNVCDNGITEEKNDGYILDSNTSCENGNKTTTSFTKNKNYTNINETISFETIKSPTVVSGTGFEFNLKSITNQVIYKANLSKGTQYNPFNNYNEFINQYNSYTSLVQSDIQKFNNSNFNNLYSGQTIKFNAVFDNNGNPINDNNVNPVYTSYTKIENARTQNLATTTYYYKSSSYECKEKRTNYGPGSYDYRYEWEGTPDRNGGTLVSNCNNSSDVGSALYAITKTSSQKVTYKYSAKLPTAHINKNDIKDILYSNPINSKINQYISAGNKFYTKISDKSGYYPFNVAIKNGGVTGNVNTSINNGTAYSCSYRVLNCAIEGVCPPTTCTDPTCINEENPEPSPGTSNHYFRPISLTNPFPNSRQAGSNWFSYKNGNSYLYITTNEDGTEKGESIYSKDPMYEIKITNQMASDIRKFNALHPDYSSDETMVTVDNGGSTLCSGLCRQSLFLSYLEGSYNGASLNLNNISRGSGLIIRDRFVRYRRNGAIETIYGGDN